MVIRERAGSGASEVRKMGSVYVVLAIDTEGPATDSRHPELLSTWGAIDKFLGKLFSARFRSQVLDGDGKGPVISWFILSWTGFTMNPVRRRFGYHRIYDHFVDHWGSRIVEYGDGIYWHYHHPAPSGVATEWCSRWSSNQEYYNILNRLVIERAYFPSVFRAGGPLETNEMSNWLEEWIPFDYSNRAGDINWDALDSGGMKVRETSDWSRAPADWSFYHPSADDYQRPGNMRRTVFRCLDLASRLNALKESDIAAAFTAAEAGKDVIMAVFDHDYRDRGDHFVEYLLKPVERVASQHPRVRWRYANALEAAQAVLGYAEKRPLSFRLSHERATGTITISADRELFGPRPYVVSKYTDKDEYVQEEPIGLGGCTWRVGIKDGGRERVIGVAASDLFGNVGVTLCRWKKGALSTPESWGE